jgi:hypothetical protein
LAKILSIAAVLALVAAAGMPVSILAQKMSAAAASTVLRDLGSFVSLALLASAITMMWVIAGNDAVTAWVGSSVTTATLMLVMSRWAGGQLARDVSMVVAAAACSTAIARWSDRAFQYCHE